MCCKSSTNAICQLATILMHINSAVSVAARGCDELSHINTSMSVLLNWPEKKADLHAH